LVTACLRLRSAAGDIETRVTNRVLRQLARRIRTLQAEAADHLALLEQLVAETAPSLLAQPGVGTITAAQLLVSWSHAGRIRNENAFAAMAGVAPVPASSGRVVRHRLNRQGDRRLNRALHVVAVCRSSFHRPTKDYIARRTAEGKSTREIRRCLKRYLARRSFRALTTYRSVHEWGGVCPLPAPYRLETVQAVHRARPRRHERHLRRLAAVGADHVVHDAGAAVAVRLPPCRPAFRAPPGLVLQ